MTLLQNEQRLLDKLRSLPTEKQTKVEDFIDFFQQHEQADVLAHAASQSSEASFQEIWDNAADAAYDEL